MGLYRVVVCYNARQDNKYNTIQQHITQNSIKHSGQLSIRKITKTKNTNYTQLGLRNK